MQGPESMLTELVKLRFADNGADPPLDSGFGPFALTRLAYETGGIYFTVHPNRNSKRAVGRGETAPFSAHVQHFFDPDIMHRYRPDYVSPKEYVRRLTSNTARGALVRTAQRVSVAALEKPRTRFVRRNEAGLAAALGVAQRDAAKLEPKIRGLYESIRRGEKDREKEVSPRWQAGYDLAMGRVLAAKVRTEGYNTVLANAKRGLKFKNPKNNTWVLKPTNKVDLGSQLNKTADKAKMYLNRVADEHAGTPWAMLAQRELRTPLGWQWQETYTNLSPRRRNIGGGGGAPRAARNEKKRMLAKPKPKRPVPKL